MDKYYYFGEFGYLNLEILGGLEEFFKRNPKKVIEVATYKNYGMLLKYLFPKNVKIRKVEWQFEEKYRLRHRYTDKFFERKINSLGFKINLAEMIERDLFGIKKINLDEYKPIYLKKIIGVDKKQNEKFISIFPRNRKQHDFRNVRKECWERIVENIDKKYPSLRIVIHGADKEFLKLDKNERFIYPKNVIEQALYLNNSICCICPNSGIAHFAVNCGCDILVMGKLFYQYEKFNPFRNRVTIVGQEDSLLVNKYLDYFINKKMSKDIFLNNLNNFLLGTLKRWKSKHTLPFEKNIKKLPMFKEYITR